MRTALIGHTGFVGKHLAGQWSFDAFYHSANIADIAGEAFDLVVCAGAPGAKYVANRDPERDRQSLRLLMDALGAVEADHLVLISTVDVYPEPRQVSESSAIDPTSATPYGRHRLELEEFARFGFEATVVRLPGLYGSGLKKNLIFDLLHGHRLAHIHPDAEYQFYCLDDLWRDIERARSNGISLLNLATEPTSARDIAAAAFGIDLPTGADNQDSRGVEPPRYDVRSDHAVALGGRAPYVCDRASVLAGIRGFVENGGWRRP